MSLGRNTHVELSLVKHAVGKLKSKYIAWAGFVYALDRIRRDSSDPDAAKQDTLYQCGVRLGDEESPQEAFKNIIVGDGYFDVQYVPGGQDGKKIYYGLQDEERRININALTVQNYNILSALVNVLGFDDETAKTIACAVLDWKDEDDSPADTTYGAEDEYYQTLAIPYPCKNRPFDSAEELLLVRGVTPEIYSALKDYVTVFPKQGTLRVNFDTAPEAVLTALARAMSEALSGAAPSDAAALVDKILRYRAGEDGSALTRDDRAVELNGMSLNATERNLFLAMSQFRTYTSDYLRVRVQGTEKVRGAKTVIEAVVYRNDLSVLQWQRE
ncbi:MAG: general secretion pathway protein GspK [Candidatus Omnitrophica bacterium]|nr:general secretion pathway protein GspK [Candidatus Omnitrophota bacterium]